MVKILIVEDDKDLNKTVCSFLIQNGYDATGCLNANEAYDALYVNLFDLMYLPTFFLTLYMPVLITL